MFDRPSSHQAQHLHLHTLTIASAKSSPRNASTIHRRASASPPSPSPSQSVDAICSPSCPTIYRLIGTTGNDLTGQVAHSTGDNYISTPSSGLVSAPSSKSGSPWPGHPLPEKSHTSGVLRLLLNTAAYQHTKKTRALSTNRARVSRVVRARLYRVRAPMDRSSEIERESRVREARSRRAPRQD